MSTLYCPHCGTANREGSNFCNRCGTDLRPDETKAPLSAPQPSSPDLPTGSSTEVDVLASTSQTAGPEPHEITFTHSLAAAPVEPGADLMANQPWLQDETLFPADETETAATFDQDATDEMAAARRLITGVQGLLEPLRIAREPANGDLTSAPRRISPAIELSLEQLRRLRGVMTQDPTLLNGPALSPWRSWPALRLPWVFALVGLMVGLPVFLLFGEPVGRVQQWPGVAEAHRVIESLPPDATVLLLWSYDPATADEMDLVALPAVLHLFYRQSQPVVVSLLPNGLATARRLFGRATADMLEDPAMQAQADQARYIEGGFLTGGAAVLPLLGQQLAGLKANPATASPALTKALAQPPALALVVAAQAEDVQQWLELVQPLNHTPVVAFTSAGADPVLRAYLASGQLRGLVTGFDGAYAYQQLSQYPLSRSEGNVYRLQLVFQNWGHLAFLLLIGLGNLAALLYTRS